MKPTAPHRVLIVTALAMLAFAGNSLLCRLALKLTAIEPLMFTAIRLLSGAVVLCAVLLLTRRRPAVAGAGSWWSAAWLFVYAAAFSMAYVRLPTGTGALLLFASVQITMFSAGIWSGERISLPKGAGLTIAMGGLVFAVSGHQRTARGQRRLDDCLRGRLGDLLPERQDRPGPGGNDRREFSAVGALWAGCCSGGFFRHADRR